LVENLGTTFFSFYKFIKHLFLATQYGSLHEHIILWVVENDIENITNEIVVFIPTTFHDK
jgi:hypothetical protein